MRVKRFPVLHFPRTDWETCNESLSSDYPNKNLTLTIIEDALLPDNCSDRAKRSVPPSLGLIVKESGIPGAGLGIWAEKFLPANLRFGPYRGETFFYDAKGADESGYSWLVCIDHLQ